MLIEDFPQMGIAFSVKSIGQVLRAARLAARISFRDLARESGISMTQLQRMEEGKTDYALTRFIRICFALGLPPGDVMERAYLVSATKPRVDVSGDNDVMEALHAARLSGVEAQKALATIGNFAGHLHWVVIHTLVSSRPAFTRAAASSPSAACHEALLKFGDMVEECSSSERLEMVRSLKIRPLDKLKSLGLITPQTIADVIAMGDISLPGLRPSRTLTRTLIAAASAGEDARISMGKVGFHTPGWLASNDSKRNEVDNISASLNILAVPETLEEIIAKVKVKSAPRGTKSALARELHVAPQQINDWLTGRSKPSAEKALVLLAWVKGEFDLKQEGGASSIKPTPPMTPKGNSKRHEETQSRPQKRSQKRK